MNNVTLQKYLAEIKLKENFIAKILPATPEYQTCELEILDRNIAPEYSTESDDGRYTFIIYSEKNLINALKLFEQRT